MQFGEQFRCHECPEFRGHNHIECKFFLIAFIRIVEFESSTMATANTSPNTASLGATGLGTSGLGTTGLGTTGLGSLPTQSGSTLQTGTSPSTATQSETTCSGYVGTLPASTTTVTAGSLSGGVPDPAQSLGSSTTDASQSLGGTASVPVTPVPCPTTSTTATIP